MISQLGDFYNKKKYILDSDENSIHKKVIKSVPNNSFVLDVGCSEGYIGKELKKKNCKVFGIEISKNAGNIAKKYLDKVTLGNIETMAIPYPKNIFDVIILLDVLEHTFDPKKILLRLKPYLKHSGFLIISLPNIAHWEVRQSLLLGKFNYVDKGLLDSGHIRFFTYDSSLQMIIDSRYKIFNTDLVIKLPSLLSKINYITPWLLIAFLCKKYFFRLFGYQFIFWAEKSLS